MRTLFSPFLAFWCMAVHRNQKMIHIFGKEHLLVCRTCDLRGKEDNAKNLILTFFFFHRNLLTALILLPVVVVAMVNALWTGRRTHLEYPPEHSQKILRHHTIDRVRLN